MNEYSCQISYYSTVIKQSVIAETYSKARYKFYKNNFAEEPYSNLFNFIKVNKIGKAKDGQVDEIKFEELEKFNQIKKYRKLEFAEIGMKVSIDDKIGKIIGANDSSNFNVDFGDGIKSNFHPTWKTTYFDKNNNVIAKF